MRLVWWATYVGLVIALGVVVAPLSDARQLLVGVVGMALVLVGHRLLR